MVTGTSKTWVHFAQQLRNVSKLATLNFSDAGCSIWPPGPVVVGTEVAPECKFTAPLHTISCFLSQHVLKIHIQPVNVTALEL